MTRSPAERLYAVACAAMYVFGITLSLPGTVVALPEAAAQFDLSLADRGTLIAMLFMGLLTGSLLSGPIVDRLGQRAVLAASTACVAACLPLFAQSPGFTLAAASLVALGLACAGLNTAANALSSDLFPRERGRRMNGLALAAGLGGLTLPTATALAAEVVSWRVITTGVGALAAVAAVAAMAVTTPAQAPRPAAVARLRDVARQPAFGWMCVMLMLGAATEASIAGWTSTYFVASGFSATAATWSLSSHWLGLVTGRTLFAGRVDRNKTAAIVRGALGGSAGVAVLLLAPPGLLLAVTPFAIGVAISVVVPTSLALAGERFTGNAGTLFGILMTVTQAGAMTVPALVGVIAGRIGLRAALSLVIVNGVIVALATRQMGRRAPGEAKAG